MKTIQFIAGDFGEGAWELEEQNLKSGFYNVEEIPISEIKQITKENEIGKDIYITVVVGIDKTFKAKTQIKTYQALYDTFLKVGGNPVGIKLPVRKKSKGNVIFALIGLFFLYAIFNGGDSSSTSDPLRKMALLSSCQVSIEKSALYGASFSGSVGASEKYEYSNGSGYNIEFPFQINNVFGVSKKAFASCDFVNSGSIIHLRIDDEKIF
ncbi:hypothetical protein [Psychromonas antarctica]|uniref:hypothetical protein n=1 Tax=Psychromonas antarctica TaxID=67573 RepID=UPI001EE7BF33|nr:hypothetical protein [Psychromonas antarctica]MCG6202510.1 hypothetical protein [Psychromonas antarctica]